MALKPTIYKFCISLSDIDRNYYDTLNLTVARHPSETPERMMARVLAFCLNADEVLTFTKGLSEPDVPDIWAHTLDGELAGLAQRTMDCSITISGESAFVAGAAGECEVDWVVLHTP
jgi:uncharacterized protein YaeQ